MPPCTTSVVPQRDQRRLIKIHVAVYRNTHAGITLTRYAPCAEAIVIKNRNAPRPQPPMRGTKPTSFFWRSAKNGSEAAKTPQFIPGQVEHALVRTGQTVGAGHTSAVRHFSPSITPAVTCSNIKIVLAVHTGKRSAVPNTVRPMRAVTAWSPKTKASPNFRVCDSGSPLTELVILAL